MVNLEKSYVSSLKDPQICSKSIQDIECTVSQMDKKYSTSFKDWVQSESNVNYMCIYKKSLFKEQYHENPETAFKVIQWMTSHWSLPSICEFILKMFTEYPIESNEFARMVSIITLNWEFTKICDLITLMLVCESPSSTAHFLFCFGKAGNGLNGDVRGALSSTEWLTLLTTMATTLSWTRDYLQSILLEYAGLASTSSLQQRSWILLIYDEFTQQDKSGTVSPISYNGTPYETSFDYLNEGSYPNLTSRRKSEIEEIRAPPNSPIESADQLQRNQLHHSWSSKDASIVMERLNTLRYIHTFLAMFELINKNVGQSQSDTDTRVYELLKDMNLI